MGDGEHTRIPRKFLNELIPTRKTPRIFAQLEQSFYNTRSKEPSEILKDKL